MEASFVTHFESLDDPRVERTKKYPLIEIIFLIISATVSGCEGWKAIKDFGELKLDWLRQYFPYKEGIPVDDTIARVIRKVDTKQFASCFSSWIGAIANVTEGEIIPIDGKTLRGSFDSNSAQSPIHMVSAWSSTNGVVLGQVKTAEKSNEITAIPELLKTLALKGCLVSIDAMGCQKAIAQQIVDKKGDYLLALKGNQGNLHDEIKSFFETALEANFKNVENTYHKDIDSGHGRIEKRECYVLNVKKYKKHFPSIVDWKKLSSLVVIKTKRQLKEKETTDTRFYISSKIADADYFLHATRQHWGIENSLHWVLDVTFNEDDSRIRKDAAPENFAIFRHIALNILRKNTSVKNSLKGKQRMAAFSDKVRSELISALNLC